MGFFIYMSDQDFLYWSGKKLLKAFKLKELSPVEVTKASLERANHIQKECNAFTDFFEKQAIDLALQSEKVFLDNAEETRLLEGIPFAIKE